MTDHFNHIANYQATMHLQGVMDKIMLCAFSMALKNRARA